jgi:DNA invertase Pin-like site-specific DNA recombinase
MAMLAANSVAKPASYSRFSSDLQNARSITDQQRKCRDRAHSDRRDICPKLEFFDEAKSGASADRAGFERMLEAARAGLISDLYVESLSRLARDCVLTLQILRELVYVHKIRIVSMFEGIDTSITGNWELLAAVFGIQHEQYLKLLAENVFRAQEGVVLDMLSVGDYCLGYGGAPIPGTESQRVGKNKNPKSTYIILWDEAEWVVRIFIWFVKERRSLRWIARQLNRMGAPKDHRASTREWYHQLLLGLLSNRKYVGWWPWGERKNVRCPMSRKVRQEKRSVAESDKWMRHFPDLQIIDDATFAEAQQYLQENAKAHGMSRDENGKLRGSTPEAHAAHPRHFLSGIVECGSCSRRFRVGGANGKYMFCPGYGMGVCTCQTTLRRDLAEEFIFGEISKRIISNPSWVDRVFERSNRSYEQIQRERPNRKKAIEGKLTELDRRIGNLVKNCEEGLIPEIEQRLKELRNERQNLRLEFKQLAVDENPGGGPPTREWIESRLMDLRSVLNARGPAAAHALRTLVGGKIVVTEVRHPGKQRHYLNACFELQLTEAAAMAGVSADIGAVNDAVEVVEIDIRRPQRREEIADEVKRLWDAGVKELDICKQLGMSRTLFSSALDYWYAKNDAVRPDGRQTRGRIPSDRRADKLQNQIMDLFKQDLPISVIAERTGCGLEVVREAVTKWHAQSGLPVPDGRARRREIRVRKRAAG